MRNVHIVVDEDTYNELRNLFTYHGEQSHMLRMMLKRFIKEYKELKKEREKEPKHSWDDANGDGK